MGITTDLSFYAYYFRLPDRNGINVHFNIHMDPSKGTTSAGEIADLFKDEILSSNVTGKCLIITFNNP